MSSWNQMVLSTAEKPEAKELRLQKELQKLEQEERIQELERRIEEARNRLRSPMGSPQTSADLTFSPSGVGSGTKLASQAKVDELKLVLVSCMGEIDALKKEVADMSAFISDFRKRQAEVSKMWSDMRTRDTPYLQ